MNNVNMKIYVLTHKLDYDGNPLYEPLLNGGTLLDFIIIEDIL